MKVSKLKLNPNNPRIIKDDKFHKLVESLKNFPEMMEKRPMVCVTDEDGKIYPLGGNMRLKAVQELKMKEIPDTWVLMADEWTEEQRKEFTIKDNVSFGEWNFDELANSWDADKLVEWGMDVPDFGTNEVLEAEEDDFEIPDEIQTDIVLGDLFEIGEHRLLCGDSTDSDSVAKLMNGELADMVMTDPPYNVSYEGGTGLTIMNDEMDNDSFYAFLLLFYKAFADVTKDGGAWYVWHADTEGVNFRKAFQESGLLMKQCLIWVKNALVMGRQDYHWKHEPCLYGWKAGAAHYFTNDRTKTTVIEDKLDIKKLKKDELLKLLTEVMSDKTKTSVIHHDKPLKNGEHPTMKPILLLAPLIENSSKPKWIVGDPFLGSGSTMVASHQLKRKCYGMELDPKYCQVIIDRMCKLDPTLVIKKNGILI
jgi:DNA modification methylase